MRFPYSARPPHDDPALIVRCTYDVFKGYDPTILENLYNSALNKIVEATETVNPYENRMIVVCHPKEIVRS